MTREAERRDQLERWIAWIRVAAVPWAVLEVGFLASGYPDGYKTWAWVITAVLAVGALAIVWLAYRPLRPRARGLLGFAALTFDTAIIYAYYQVFAFEPVIPARALIFLAVVEAAVRYGLRGGVLWPLATGPFLLAVELSRADRFAPPDFELRNVSLPLGVQLTMGLIVGGLVRQVWRETRVAEARAAEAETLRDQIGRRADQLEVVNRCARALASSLDLEEAFRAFVLEARNAVDFDRLALVLVERDRAHVIANDGVGETTLFPQGSSRPLEGSVLDDLMRHGQTVVRGDIAAEKRYPEDEDLARAGLRSEVVAPLAVGGRTLGMLSMSRTEAHSFTAEEIELVTLLARQVATTVENIRAFEAEHVAADELRRLSALRADFVSLVSHELRTPMASVIGSAATLRERWRSLTPEQRESFLALIETETTRLAGLIGDVLDTSRLDAGTFTYNFAEVDLGELVREVAGVVDLGQEEVAIRADVDADLPRVHGDRERIRQLLLNLVTNAVKYTVADDEVEISAAAANGAVVVSVRDHGPGIPADQQRVIFEKFGRAPPSGKSKPGAGLGLFIARSIAEAHGGSLDVDSTEGRGATFTLRLPAAPR